MSRNTSYMFVAEEVETIIARKTAKFEELSGRTVLPSSPEKLFITWDAYNELVLRQAINAAARKNMPFSAEGDDLDRCGEMYYGVERPAAKPAITTLRFTISEAQNSAVLIPAGTRVTTVSGTPIFETDEDVYVTPGNTTATISATCQTEGTDGNGFATGQLNSCVDLFAYYNSVTNITVTDGGADEATDDEYYELMIARQDAYSTAGSEGAYQYFAKSVSTEIQDVLVNSPSAGIVDIYTLMSDGTKASTTIKDLILERCTKAEDRPLTDYVRTQDPEEVVYNINMTYYIPRGGTESITVVQAKVEEAVNDYIAWQSGKLGRDINPDELTQKAKTAGVKRAVITSPVYTALRNGVVTNPVIADPEDYIPQLAQIGTVTLINGGYEDE